MAPARLLSDNEYLQQREPSDPVCDVAVLIIGAGPAGLLQAHLLSKLGVSSLVVERYPTRLAAPKAHALSPRTIELCRQSGLDTKLIRQLGTTRDDARYVNFITNLSGQGLGRLPYERMDVKVLDDTPEMIHNIPQPVFEELVFDELTNNAESSVRIVKNVSFVKCEQTKAGVLTTVEDRTASSFYTISSLHVIACDGARSKVRESLGIETEGASSAEMMMTIHFQCNLRPILGERVGMLHWILDPEVSGFIINYDPSGNQVLICNFDEKKNPVAKWDEALCRRTLIKALGQDAPLQILSWRPWIFSRKVANQYRSGGVFLAGDAAHSFPRTGGLGLNSGLADVHNLAWKIAAVHQGWGSSSLLDTYHTERRHVAIVNSEQSVKNGLKIFAFLKALGATVDDVEEARSNLLKTINDPSQADAIAAHVEGQREHFDNLELHIGYVYGDVSIPKHASLFTPKYIPGARLPHAWIKPLTTRACNTPPIDVSYIAEFDNDAIVQRQYSTLDLCSMSEFTLITKDNSIWHTQFDQIKQKSHICLPLRLMTEDVDFSFVDAQSGGQWTTSFGLEDGGAVLVRPDQHVLFVAKDETSVAEICDVLHGYLGLPLSHSY